MIQASLDRARTCSSTESSSETPLLASRLLPEGGFWVRQKDRVLLRAGAQNGTSRQSHRSSCSVIGTGCTGLGTPGQGIPGVVYQGGYRPGPGTVQKPRNAQNRHFAQKTARIAKSDKSAVLLKSDGIGLPGGSQTVFYAGFRPAGASWRCLLRRFQVRGRLSQDVFYAGFRPAGASREAQERVRTTGLVAQRAVSSWTVIGPASREPGNLLLGQGSPGSGSQGSPGSPGAEVVHRAG